MAMAEAATRIVRDPNVLSGKPVVRGTRVSVEQVLGLIAEGMGEAEIVRSYPTLTIEDVRACAAYAAEHIDRAPSSAA
jgi:uncharacterized protein (DUF433 family)